MMEGTAPLVSICIPTFNRADMIGKAIESATGQSYRNIEIIVVDNASTDNTRSVVSAYTDPRIRYIRNPENLGLFGNANRCIELSGGKYIHILHSDDFIDPQFTATCVEFFEAHPEVAMTFTSTRIMTGDTVHGDCVLFDRDTIFSAPEGFRRILSQRPFVSCPSVMVRKTVYEQVGKYSLEYPYSADYYLWLQISHVSDIAYIKDAWLFYRQGEHSETYRLLFSSPAGYLDGIKILTRVVVELGDDRRLFSRELNIAMRRHMHDCLYAGIMRSKIMKSVPVSLFIGFAFTMWTLIRPSSFRERCSKFFDLFHIGIVWIMCLLPCGRDILSKVLHLEEITY